MSPLVLLPVEADSVLEERRGKGNSDRPYSSGSSKVVLTLLTEVVAVYVRLSVVYVWGAGLQLLPGHLGDDGSWDKSGSKSGNGNGSSSLQNGLKNPLQVILRVLGDTNISEKLWPWGFFRLFRNFRLGRWRGVRGSVRESNRRSNGGSNGRSNGGSNRRTLLAGTSAASD